MTDTFDPTKPVQTRDGYRVVIHETDVPDNYPIRGSVYYKDGAILNYMWTKEGRISDPYESPWDLVNIFSACGCTTTHSGKSDSTQTHSVIWWARSVR